MALGNNQNNDNSKLLILKVKNKDAEGVSVDPHFQINEKGENGKWAPVGTVSAVSGDLVRSDVKEGEYEGQKTYNISLYLKDSDVNELYLVDLKLNMLTRSILNSLLNLKEFNDVKLSLYKNGKGYDASAVRQKGEISKWKYSLDELPKVDSIVFKGKKMNDYSNVDEFFIGKVKELGARLAGVGAAEPAAEKAPPAKTKAAKGKKAEKAEPVEEKESDNDLF